MISVVKRFGGIEVSCCGSRILIDPTRAFPASLYDAVMITHAHSDHYTSHISKARRIIMSPETYRVLREHRGLTLGANVVKAHPERAIVFDKFNVVPLNAGHVMGSLMYLVEFKEGTVLVTGDINTEDSLVMRGAKPYEGVDILVMESTYGNQLFKFSPREEVYEQILDVAEKAVRRGLKLILSGFALGKGQELYMLLSRGKYSIMMDRQVFSLNSILLGLNKPYGDVHDYEVAIVDMPPRVKVNADSVVAMVTGGAPLTRLEGGYLHIQLSNHSDFEGLVNFALGTGARKIYTVYGHSEELARYLRREYGLNSHPLPSNILEF